MEVFVIASALALDFTRFRYMYFDFDSLEISDEIYPHKFTLSVLVSKVTHPQR